MNASVVRAALAAALLGACKKEAEPTLLASGLPAGLLSVRALAPDDVWIYGASTAPDDGGGPVALHYDGAAWERLDLSAWSGAELWWGHVVDGQMVLVGDGGLILEGPVGGPFTAVPGPSPETTFFGVWGASADDLWVVGMEGGGLDAAALWRRSAGVWSAFDPGVPTGAALFKVDGRSGDDVWVVGSGGVTLRWDGTAWAAVPTGFPTAPLLTVDAQGDRPLAVGGAGNALLLEHDGAAWQDASPAFVPGLNGVCTGAGAAWAVGQRGARVERVDGAWLSDEDRDVAALIADDWHGCAIDPDGGLWMAGGRIASRPLTDGAVGYQGPGSPPPISL